jgi:hypothetical protein
MLDEREGRMGVIGESLAIHQPTFGKVRLLRQFRKAEDTPQQSLSGQRL